MKELEHIKNDLEKILHEIILNQLGRSELGDELWEFLNPTDEELEEASRRFFDFDN